MSLDYVRKIVSGKKARFVDTEMSVNLDLVYGESLRASGELSLTQVTDRIIMCVGCWRISEACKSSIVNLDLEGRC